MSNTNYDILRFYQYREAEDHWNYLQDNLKFKGWKWVERENPAARFPTDFGLVAIDESAKELLLEKFIELNLVKDVSLDLSYQKIVLEEKSEKLGAFANGKKRQGKIFTAMSFSEGQNYAVANTSKLKISWNRHLLMQASPLMFLCLVMYDLLIIYVVGMHATFRFAIMTYDTVNCIALNRLIGN